VKAIHFGAGNIGKGFIGNLLHKTGYHVCFVDVNQEVIQKINDSQGYEIQLLDDDHTSEIITNVSALNSKTQENDVIQEITRADLITTSVGANNLHRIAPILAKGLLVRIQENKRSINIMANENAINATNILKLEIDKHLTSEEIKQVAQFIGFPNTAIDRLALTNNNNSQEKALVEPFYEWIINRSEMKNDGLQNIYGATYVSELTPYLERKLYTVNTGHATAAYLGYLLGEKTVQSAIALPFIEEHVRGALKETGSYLIEKFGLHPEDHQAYIDKTIIRFKNKNATDEVIRVARSPIRKIGFNERLVGPARHLVEMGKEVEYLSIATATAFLYNNSQDEESVEIQNAIATLGLEKSIQYYTNLEKSHELISKIKEKYTELSNKFHICS